MQRIQINETGLAMIRDFLAAHHKLGGDHFTDNMLSAWASHAEDSWAQGNGVGLDLVAGDTVQGKDAFLTIGPEGYDLINDT